MHDFAQVFVNGKRVGTADRRLNESSVVLPALSEGDRLDILVEAFGRVNFGQAIKDYKGITERVCLAYALPNGSRVTVDMKGWEIFGLDDAYETQRDMNYRPLTGERGPGCYRATFSLKRVGDTFLDLERWGKGQVYVNGHAIGRHWFIGPQQTLYMPGCWLRKGENEIIVQDVIGPTEPVVEGLAVPVIDKLNVGTPATHRKEGQVLDLTGETATGEGVFAPGNGWQEVLFDAPVEGRYVCIEALDSHSEREYACIAEWYMLGADGRRIDRETWRVPYCDSEDVTTGNKAADKLFDLQESTYWSTVRGAQFPHHVVLDLGSVQRLAGFQYLPRVEKGAPESIRRYRIYVKREPFRF